MNITLVAMILLAIGVLNEFDKTINGGMNLPSLIYTQACYVYINVHTLVYTRTNITLVL